MRIGLVSEGFEDCEKDVESLVRGSAMKLQTLGAQVEAMSIPMQKYGNVIFLCSLLFMQK